VHHVSFLVQPDIKRSHMAYILNASIDSDLAELCHNVWHQRTRMMGLPGGKNVQYI